MRDKGAHCNTANLIIHKGLTIIISKAMYVDMWTVNKFVRDQFLSKSTELTRLVYKVTTDSSTKENCCYVRML